MPSLANKNFRLATTFGVVAACSSLIFAHAPLAQAGCTFLMPIGGNGDGPKPYIVKKRVERPKGLIGKAVGRTNWNTDFVVNQPYAFYKLFFTADSTDNNPGSYPIEAFLKFSDGSNLKVVEEFMKPPTGTGAQFGPLAAPSGKAVSQVNFRIGSNNDPGATGFTYRISVQGCD